MGLVVVAVECLDILRATGLAPIVESALVRWFDPERLSQDPALAQRLRAMMAATSLDGYVGGVSALLDYDLHAVINALRLPLLFLAGERDGTAPEVLGGLAATIPQARFRSVPAAGHISCIDGAPTFTAALTTFLDSLTDTDGANT